ncbi:MAG: MscS Mechanosensitive ion channel [Acidobacteriaceae bacterium]|nr:MscS Mechanosensitive ion channel [Acidobacteriaceae bacterium]
MVQVKSKSEGSWSKFVHAWHRTSFGLIVTTLIAVSIPIGQQHWAFSQSVTIAGFDAGARGREIIAHLNSVIQFYRVSTQPIQKTGESNDVVYRDQAAALSSDVARFAFQSAKAEAVLLAAYESHLAASQNGASTSEQEKMQVIEANVDKHLSDLQIRKAALDKQIASAKPQAVAALRSERKRLDGTLDLSNAMREALQKIVAMSGSTSNAGLAGDIDRLQSPVPELQSKNKPAPPQLATLDAARSSGVTSQGMILIDLLETKHGLDSLLHNNDKLHKQALDMQVPISTVLRALVHQGQQMSE